MTLREIRAGSRLWEIVTLTHCVTRACAPVLLPLQVDVLNSQLRGYEAQSIDKQRMDAAIAMERRAREDAEDRLGKVGRGEIWAVHDTTVQAG